MRGILPEMSREKRGNLPEMYRKNAAIYLKCIAKENAAIYLKCVTKNAAIYLRRKKRGYLPP